ncbi:MAG: hypothetical protein ACE5J4_01965 [Candidatus Aenigmatarchaeota archaeon]
MVKGFIQTLEAVIAAVLILITILILYQPKPLVETQLQEISYNCLVDLDNKGFLRYYLDDPEEIENKLKSCLPPLTDFVVKVCTNADCVADVPSKTVVLSSYLVSGYYAVSPRLVNLWVWYK